MGRRASIIKKKKRIKKPKILIQSKHNNKRYLEKLGMREQTVAFFVVMTSKYSVSKYSDNNL